MAKKPKEQLLEVLDRDVFDPVIKARQDDYAGDRRRDLADIQKTTRSTKACYHRYSSAVHVKRMFEDDLRSPFGQAQTEKLHDLGLPGFPDVESEFRQKADELGVQ